MDDERAGVGDERAGVDDERAGVDDERAGVGDEPAGVGDERAIRSVTVRPLEVRDGRALVPGGPGVGMEWDEIAVARLMR